MFNLLCYLERSLKHPGKGEDAGFVEGLGQMALNTDHRPLPFNETGFLTLRPVSFFMVRGGHTLPPLFSILKLGQEKRFHIS
jgi:hypothetical protein